MQASASLPLEAFCKFLQSVRRSFTLAGMRTSVCANVRTNLFQIGVTEDNHIQKAQNSWEVKMAAKQWASDQKKKKKTQAKSFSDVFVMFEKRHEQIDFKCDVVVWQKDIHEEIHFSR